MQDKEKEKKIDSEFVLESLHQKSLSLRKRKLEEKLLSYRLQKNEIFDNNLTVHNYLIAPFNYKIEINQIENSQFYISKQYKSNEEILTHTKSLLNSNDVNQKKAAICIMKKCIDNPDNIFTPDKFLNLKFDEDFYSILENVDKENKNNNLSIVYELINLILNLSFNSNEIVNKFITHQFIKIYNKLLVLYSDDIYITNGFVVLFCNLVADNHEAKKILYESEIFYSISQKIENGLNPQVLENIFYFLCAFVSNIHLNIFFLDKNDFLIKCQNLFLFNLKNKELEKLCLIGLGSISQIENSKLMDNILKNNEFFNYLAYIKDINYAEANQIICNLFSVSEEYDEKILDNYSKIMLEFLYKGLNQYFIRAKVQVLWILQNILSSSNNTIIQNLIDTQIVQKVLNILNEDSHQVLIINCIKVINIIIDKCNLDQKKYLINIKVVDVYMKILEKWNEMDSEIIDCLLDGVYIMLTVDNKHKLQVSNINKFDGKYESQSFYDCLEVKGTRDMLDKIAINGKKENGDKAEKLLDEFFKDYGAL